MSHRDVSVRLHNACRRSGVSLEGIAHESGIRIETLRKIARGDRMPLTTTALRIAASLGMEVEDLFGGTRCR